MKIENLEKNNNLEKSNNLVTEKTQKSFLETTLGKTINSAVDFGIRAILPNFIEDQVINIKDSLLKFGKEGISKTINAAIDFGKNAIGLVNEKFENVSQMQKAVASGGLIEGMSSLLDVTVDNVKKAGAISSGIADKIKEGKDIILNSLENNIDNTFKNQYNAIENTNKYIDNWKNCFENKDFKGMEKEYKKIESKLKQIAPIENIINSARTVEVLHNLIKNNGKDFNLTKDQLELAEKLKNFN